MKSPNLLSKGFRNTLLHSFSVKKGRTYYVGGGKSYLGGHHLSTRFAGDTEGLDKYWSKGT